MVKLLVQIFGQTFGKKIQSNLIAVINFVGKLVINLKNYDSMIVLFKTDFSFRKKQRGMIFDKLSIREILDIFRFLNCTTFLSRI